MVSSKISLPNTIKDVILDPECFMFIRSESLMIFLIRTKGVTYGIDLSISK